MKRLHSSILICSSLMLLLAILFPPWRCPVAFIPEGSIEVESTRFSFIFAGSPQIAERAPLAAKYDAGRIDAFAWLVELFGIISLTYLATAASKVKNRLKESHQTSPVAETELHPDE